MLQTKITKKLLKTLTYKKMSLEDLFSKNITDLPRNNKKPPKRETLRLYREVVKFCKEFHWIDDKGELWSERLQKSARDEIIMAKDENDPVVIQQMLVTSHQVIEKLREKLIEKYSKVNQGLQTGEFKFNEERRNVQDFEDSLKY